MYDKRFGNQTVGSGLIHHDYIEISLITVICISNSNIVSVIQMCIVYTIRLQ